MSDRDAAAVAAAGMRHPLMGADLLTLVRVFARGGGIARSALPLAACAFGSALARAPFTLAEQGWAALRAPAQAPAPVFIVGHWRSGTTHLYNLLSRDPRFGYVTPVATGLPWDFLLLGRLLRPLLERLIPSERFIDRVPVTARAPQEDELALASMQALSFYHGIYFPRRLEDWFDRGVFFDAASPREVRRWCARMRLFVDKLSLSQPGQRLLIKNPVYSARIALLRTLWPEARFIHIHRNPWVVFQSTRNFYRKLLPRFSLQPYDPAAIDELVLSRYPRMMQCLLDDLDAVPRGRAIEVGFDELERAPMALVERIYDTLGLEGFESSREAFERYLATVSGYRRNRYDFARADAERVATRWRPFIERWGYEEPA